VADAEGAPDLDLKPRVIRRSDFDATRRIDLGAYEYGEPCTSGDANHSGAVNIDDLLVVINHWGPCPSFPANCPGDLTSAFVECVLPAPASVVNIDDLLIVINTWGQHCLPTPPPPPGSFNSVQDCMNAATGEELTPYSTEWNEWVSKCVEGLCQAQIISCD
jgi:hypothetical protein